MFKIKCTTSAKDAFFQTQFSVTLIFLFFGRTIEHLTIFSLEKQNFSFLMVLREQRPCLL